MAEHTGSGAGTTRERLARAKAQQSESATAEQAEPKRGGLYGTQAARAAALIAGQADPGPGEDDEDNDDDGDAGREGEAAPPRDSGPLEDDQAGEGEDEDDGQAEGELKTVGDAAKRLGMKTKEFNSLVVESGGVSMTLGELKAHLPEVAKLAEAREQFDDARGRWELERVASYRNINAIADVIPKNAQTAELLRQLEQHHEAARARELESLHFARPKWSDPNYATATRTRIVNLAKEYGFTRPEVEAIMDHRQVLLVQDFADLRDKVRASRDTARKVAEPGGDRPTGQAAAAGRDLKRTQSSNGAGRDRHSPKPTREAAAALAGAILRKR